MNYDLLLSYIFFWFLEVADIYVHMLFFLLFLGLFVKFLEKRLVFYVFYRIFLDCFLSFFICLREYSWGLDLV